LKPKLVSIDNYAVMSMPYSSETKVLN